LDQSTIHAASKAVSSKRLMQTVQALARWVKLSGTDEELESFRYVRERMDALGFRTRMIEHDAYISLPGRADVQLNGTSVNCITHSMSRSSPPEGTTGRLVYCGAGTEEDFAKQDLQDCILLLEGMATPTMAWRASRAGAAGQIHVTPDDQLHEMCVSAVWGNPTPESRTHLPSTVLTTISRTDGARMREMLEKGLDPKVVIHAEVDTGWRKTPILVADMDSPGQSDDAPYVMFSGHIDTWYYGVMDNGAANATMIEAAEVCAQHRDRWKRGLRLCFWSGHSHGRYSGSAWFADEYWDELDRRCVAHVNVDSTGGIGADNLTVGAADPELQGLAAEAIASEADQKTTGRRIGRGGDESFWGVGIPSMFGAISHQYPSADKDKYVYHLGWWWHTTHDTIDKIDENNLNRDTRVFAYTLLKLLTSRVAPLDYSAYAAAFIKELSALKLDERAFSTVPLMKAATDLEKNSAALRKLASSADDATAARINATLMRMARALVPIDCTAGDRFDHDPALVLPAWPALKAIKALAKLDPSSEQWLYQATSAKRARNRIAHALREANAAAESVLD
jgi:hypothetical protein